MLHFMPPPTVLSWGQRMKLVKHLNHPIAICHGLMLLSTGCADITPIEDGAKYGSVTVIQDWFTSFALIQHDDEAILIDAGFRAGKVESRLNDYNLDPMDIDRILMTHGHGDHIGGIELFEHAEVYALASERENLETEGARIDVPLEDGDRIPIGDKEIMVYSVPGHTDGTVVYLIDDVLLLGDAALVNEAREITGVPENRSDDPETAAKNLSLLADLLMIKR